MTTRSETSQKNKWKTSWKILFLGAAILLGSFVRMYPVLIVDFPLNDGGMFYVMINDLVENGFRSSAITTYNLSDIPFAYPPLSFYITGGLSQISGISVLNCLRFLPAVLSCLTIPAFFFLAKTFFKKDSTAVLAVLAFAFLPRTYSWFILGGGISRAFYLLFYLLAAAYTIRLFRDLSNRRSDLIMCAMFYLLAVLSHPEGALHATAMGMFFLLIFGRNKRGLFNGLIVAGLVFIFSSVWWLDVLLSNGMEPFLSALQTGGHSLLALWYALVPAIGEEQWIDMFTVLGIIGVFTAFRKKQWLLPLWYLFPLVVEPRSAFAISIIPLAMLSGLGLETILNGVFADADQNPENDNWLNTINENRLVQALLGYLIVLGLISSFSFSLQLGSIHLSASEREAMQWVQENTKEDAKFIILTGVADPFADPVSEWFPALAERHSINTIQGMEWTASTEFKAFKESLPELQSCTQERVDCIYAWADKVNIDFSYSFLTKPEDAGNSSFSSLIADLEQNETHRLVYENDGVLIFLHE